MSCEVKPPVGSASCAGDVRGSIVIDTVVESSCGMLNTERFAKVQDGAAAIQTTRVDMHITCRHGYMNGSCLQRGPLSQIHCRNLDSIGRHNRSDAANNVAAVTDSRDSLLGYKIPTPSCNQEWTNRLLDIRNDSIHDLWCLINAKPRGECLRADSRHGNTRAASRLCCVVPTGDPFITQNCQPSKQTRILLLSKWQ
ncbi:hypothetical protein J6590_065017 [Homalodisca vitripennis]|nr:hypothetical protein J6590_065017 [Homalodisca vitripennis]